MKLYYVVHRMLDKSHTYDFHPQISHPFETRRLANQAAYLKQKAFGSKVIRVSVVAL